MFKKSKKNFKKLLTMACSMVFALAAVPALASGETPSLSIDFNVADMFVWSQTIINAMLPVVYITMGLGLGFLIIRSLRAAFN